MKKGNIVRIQISRTKYNLPPSTSEYGDIFIGTILQIHKHKISVKIMDLWSKAKSIKYLTILKEEIIAIL